MKTENTFPYEDIILLTPTDSETHPRMSRGARAAQFAPFAAMVGHDAAIAEVDRQTEQRRHLSEDERTDLNDAIVRLAASPRGTEVEITYFRPDERKSGGAYITTRGGLSLVNAPLRRIEFVGGGSVNFADVYSVRVGEELDFC